MDSKARLFVVVVVLVIALTAFAAPAFGSQHCRNPQGNHTGWESCNACCEIPRGEIRGWVTCSGGCCLIPPGQIGGWAECD